MIARPKFDAVFTRSLHEQNVMLDADLAVLYGLSTKRFNEQVRRNHSRFPADFMFQLSGEDWESLRSQLATLNAERGRHRKCLPYAFTEHHGGDDYEFAARHRDFGLRGARICAITRDIGYAQGAGEANRD